MIDAVYLHVYKYIFKPLDREVLLKAVAEALVQRNPVLLALEQMAEKSTDEPILLVGRQSLTPKQLYDEVRRETEIGKKFYEEYLKSLTDFKQVPGSNGLAILGFDNIHLLKNKFVFALACKSAKGLGPKAIEAGVAGYLGFKDDFEVALKAPWMLFEVFLSGLMDLLKRNQHAGAAEKRIAGEAARYMGILKQAKSIDRAERDYVITTLRHNLECMELLGDRSWRIG